MTDGKNEMFYLLNLMDRLSIGEWAVGDDWRMLRLLYQE
jgi:hypothetical protein